MFENNLQSIAGESNLEQYLLSVIVPIYNVESYLEKCIESILNQTYRNLEIILVDDGSTDGSGAICDEYRKKDARIKVIHKQNEGLVKTRKCGLFQAKGDYIGWVDADDWIELDMYEQLMNKVQEYDCDIVISGRVEEYKDESKCLTNKCPSGYYSREEMEQFVFPHMLYNRKGECFDIFPTVWDKVFRREVLEKVLPKIPEDIRVGEDVACAYPAILEANSIYILDKCLYHYIKYRTTSLLHLKDSECFTRIYSMQDYLSDVFSKIEFPNNMMEQLSGYLWGQIEGSVGKEFQVRNPYRRSFSYPLPYKVISRNARIILYGAGRMGKDYWHQLQYSKYCNVVAWTDKNWKAYGIDSTECIRKDDYDYIVIAVVKEAVAEEIKADLINQGVSEEKILWIGCK